MSDEPGFGPETHGTYEPTAEEIAARARRQVDDALDRLEALSGPSDSIRGKALATVRDALSRLRASDAEKASELERLREERDEWERIAENRATYAHEQAARMSAHASAPQPTPVSGVPLAATGKASEGAEGSGSGIDTRYRESAEAAEAEVRRLREERDALDRLRQQINKSRATYVPGTPEKYPATELRGLTVLEAEALLAQAEQLREERDRLASSGGAYMVRALAAEAEARRLKATPPLTRITELEAINVQLARQVRRLTEGLRETEDVLASVGNWLAGSPEPTAAVIEAIDLRIGKNRDLLSADPPEGDAAAGSSPSDGGGA